MNKLLILLFIVLVIGQEVETNQTESNNETSEKVQQRTREDLLKERDTLNVLLKTLNYSCIVLARMQLSRYKNELMEVIESHPSKQEQHLAWKKIYTAHVQQCQKSITYDDSVKIFTLIKTNDFKFEEYSHIYENMTLEDFKQDKLDLKFTSAEEKVWGYIQEFEKAMNEKDEEEEVNNQIKKLLDLEPKIFGFSLKSSKYLQYLMFFGFIGLIGYLVYVVQKSPHEIVNKKKKK